MSQPPETNSPNNPENRPSPQSSSQPPYQPPNTGGQPGQPAGNYQPPQYAPPGQPQYAPQGQPPQGQPQYPPPGQPPQYPPQGGYNPSQQPGQPPYGYAPPGGYVPPGQQLPPLPNQQLASTPPVMSAPKSDPLKDFTRTGEQVTADVYERVLSFLGWVWLAFFGFGIGGGLVSFRANDFGVNTYQVAFDLDLGALFGIALAVAVFVGLKTSQLASHHAKQAIILGLSYLLLRAVLSILYLIPQRGVQDILLTGIVVGAIRVLFAIIALLAGIRALVKSEKYTIPFIGGLLK